MIAVHILCIMLILIICSVLPVTDGIIAAGLAGHMARLNSDSDGDEQPSPGWRRQESIRRRQDLNRQKSKIRPNNSIRRQQSSMDWRERERRNQAAVIAYNNAIDERIRMEENKRANRIKVEQSLGDGRPPSYYQRPGTHLPPSIRKQNSNSGLQRPPSIRKQNSSPRINGNTKPKQRKGWRCWFGSCFRN